MIFNLQLTVYNAKAYIISLWFKSGVEDMAPIERLLMLVRSQSCFARELGISPQAVDGWRRRGQVPAERVLDIERITGGAITRYELRPDIYGEPPHRAA